MKNARLAQMGEATSAIPIFRAFHARVVVLSKQNKAVKNDSIWRSVGFECTPVGQLQTISMFKVENVVKNPMCDKNHAAMAPFHSLREHCSIGALGSQSSDGVCNGCTTGLVRMILSYIFSNRYFYCTCTTFGQNSYTHVLRHRSSGSPKLRRLISVTHSPNVVHCESSI
jgi:hypothetical protein